MSGIFVFVPIFLFALDGISLSGGETLTKTIWDKIAGITDKIQVSGDNLNLTGGLKISGKLCLENGECLGECEDGFHWDKNTTSCANNIKLCDIENGTGNQTWTGTDRGICQTISCNDGYVQSGNSCATNWECFYDLSAFGSKAIAFNTSKKSISFVFNDKSVYSSELDTNSLVVSLQIENNGYIYKAGNFKGDGTSYFTGCKLYEICRRPK